METTPICCKCLEECNVYYFDESFDDGNYVHYEGYYASDCCERSAYAIPEESVSEVRLMKENGYTQQEIEDFLESTGEQIWEAE